MSAGGKHAEEAIGCHALWKRFGEVVANRAVSWTVGRETIHAVVGENGAGKSTLMRALYGLAPPDEGEVRIFGRQVARPSVEESLRRHVGMVHQHFMLVPTLTALENVVLGQEPTRGPLLALQKARQSLRALAERHHLNVEPDRLVGELSVGEAQRVEILRLLFRGAELLILDEPTAVLSPPEVEELFTLLRHLQEAGKTIVIVTHKLDEVRALCDRVTVLRRGEVVANFDVAETTSAELARAMVGEEMALSFTRSASTRGERRLSLEGISVERDDGTPALIDVTLTVHSGETVGIAGVEGNGQAELQEVVAGLRRPTKGRLRLGLDDVTYLSPKERFHRGLGYIPEDRQTRGLILDWSVEENIYLGHATHGSRLLLPRVQMRADAARLLNRFEVRPIGQKGPTAPVASFSGGNQQKIVVGRELERRPKVLVAAQPTRGVDLAAMRHIHLELDALRRAGAAMLLLSADLDELFSLSDRIAVLYRGRLWGPYRHAGGPNLALRERVGQLMLGASLDEGRP